MARCGRTIAIQAPSDGPNRAPEPPVARRPERHSVDKPVLRQFAHRERLRQINKDYVARLGSNGASPASPVAEPLTCRLIANRSWAALVDRRLALST